MPPNERANPAWPSTFNPTVIQDRPAVGVLLSHAHSSLFAPFLARENTIV